MIWLAKSKIECNTVCKASSTFLQALVVCKYSSLDKFEVDGLYRIPSWSLKYSCLVVGRNYVRASVA